MKKYKLAIVLISLLLFSIAVIAQQFEIKGRIVEQTTLETLPGASIAIYSKIDATLIKGAVADTVGIFKIQHLKRGNYLLVCSFIGFINDTLSVNLHGNKNLGDISLKASILLLEEVSLTTNKPILSYNLEKKIYHVDQDIMARSGTVTEILQNIPSITVDINGVITLRNTSNITYFINGKPSALLRRNPSAILQQMPASSIERIEIITNPTAKYRPDGVSGILNIVLKKESSEGFSGQINANIGNEERYNTNINMNYAKEDFKLFGNYGFRHSNGIVLFEDKRTYKDSISKFPEEYYNETGSSQTKALSHNAFAGVNYNFNDFNNIELSATYFYQKSKHHGNSNISGFNSLEVLDYRFINKQTNDEFEKEGELNFTYEHSFKNNESQSLSLEATYAAYNEREDKSFNQIYSLPDNHSDISKYLIQKGGHQSEILVDYTLPFGEDAEFESGYAGEFIYDNIQYTNNSQSNKFLFSQQLNALYALYGQSIGKFNYKAGLRAEQTFIKSHLVFPTNSLVSNNYFKIFPTIHLGFKLNNNKQISLSYSKRLNRPDSDELNPYPEFSDPRNAEAGNPNLKPEQIHSLEFGYRFSKNKFSIISALYYHYKYDAFTTIIENIGDNIVLYTTTNLNTRQSGGLESALSGKLFKIWDYNLAGNIYYSTIDASNLGYTNKSSISGNLKGYSLFKIANNTFIQLNAYHYFPSITPQGRREPYYYINAGFKQNLLKQKASLTITGTDVFHTYKIKYNINSTQFDQFTNISRNQPIWYIGFIWRVNNFSDKEKLNFEKNGLVK